MAPPAPKLIHVAAWREQCTRRAFLFPWIRRLGTETTEIEEARTLEAALAQCAENKGTDLVIINRSNKSALFSFQTHMSKFTYSYKTLKPYFVSLLDFIYILSTLL